MAFNVKNIDYIRSQDPKIAEAFDSLANAHSNLTEQTNGASNGPPIAPPTINQLNVSASNGHFSAAIIDNNDIYRGVQYYIEHADNPAFQNPHVVPLGDSRNWHSFLGNSTRYFRAYSAYPSSRPSSAVYHGGSGSPVPVFGGGSVPGAALLRSESSGTGIAGQGITGPGITPWRSSTGKPPIRGTVESSQGSGVGTGTAAGAPPPGNAFGGALAATQQTNQGGVAVPPLFDTYANWTLANYNPLNYAAGTTFNISDRNNVIYRVQIVAGVNKWVYFSGVYQTLQATIPTTGFNGAALGTNDTGLQVNSTDYCHIHQWTGSGWKFAGLDNSNFVSDALATPPQGGLWGACDGSSYLVMQSDATLVNTPTPTWNGSDSFEQANGTHTAGTASVASAGITPTSIESATHNHTFSGSGSTGTTTVNAGTGSPVTVGAGGTVTISGTTGTESATHTHLAAAPSETAGGLPKRIAFQKYLRR